MSPDQPILQPNELTSIISDFLISNSRLNELNQNQYIQIQNSSPLNSSEEKPTLDQMILNRIREEQKKESLKIRGEIFEIEDLNLSALQDHKIFEKVLDIKWVISNSLNHVDYDHAKSFEMLNDIFDSSQPNPNQKPGLRVRVSRFVKGLVLSLKTFLLTNSDLLQRGFYGNILTPESNILTIFEAFAHSWSLAFVVFFYLLNLLTNASFLTVPPVLMLLLFGLVFQPFPPTFFWKMCILYQMLLIIIKLGYHLPPFCLHKFTFAFSENCYSIRSSMSGSFLLSPEFLGFAKPKVNNMIELLLYDVFSLLALLFHRATLIRMGVWEFVCLSLGISLFLVRLLSVYSRYFPVFV